MPPDARQWRGLDGLRAIAALAIVALHLGRGSRWALPGGYLAVDVFFVLSGFLITSLLVREWGSAGRVAIGRFYARRLFRLYPALACVVGAAVAAVELAPHRLAASAGPTLHGAPYALLFVGNWQTAFAPIVEGMIAQTWSLGTEEQFYLVWAPVLVIVLRRRVRRETVAILMLAAVAVQVTLRAAIVYGHPVTQHWLYRIYFAPDLHSEGLLLGCVLGLLARSGPRDRLPVLSAAATAGAAGLLALAEMAPFSEAHQVWAPIAAAVASLPVVLCCVVLPRCRLATALGARPLVWLGERSYGLYVWHFPLLSLPALLPWLGRRPQVLQDAVIVVAAVVVAAISRAVIEVPFMRLGRRLLGPKGHTAAPAIGGEGSALSAAGVSVGEPEASAHAGRPRHMAPAVCRAT